MSELENPVPVESGPAGDALPKADANVRAEARLQELKTRVSSAAKLIAELREANYALAGEVAALNRRVEELEASPPPEPPAGEAASATAEAPADVSRERDQLALVLEERKAIRRKLEKLVEQVEKLET